MIPLETPQVLDVSQVAALMRCSPKTVQARARAGDLPGLKWGDDWVFPAGALARRLDELALQTKPAAPEPAPSGVLHDIKAANSHGGGKRKPPALPAL